MGGEGGTSAESGCRSQVALDLPSALLRSTNQSLSELRTQRCAHGTSKAYASPSSAWFAIAGTWGWQACAYFSSSTPPSDTSLSRVA